MAAEGGQSKLSSSWRIYNELAETRLDLIATLAEDWVAEKSVSIRPCCQSGASHGIADTADSFGNPEHPYYKRPPPHYQPVSDWKEERILI